MTSSMRFPDLGNRLSDSGFLSLLIWEGLIMQNNIQLRSEESWANAVTGSKLRKLWGWSLPPLEYTVPSLKAHSRASPPPRHPDFAVREVWQRAIVRCCVPVGYSRGFSILTTRAIGRFGKDHYGQVKWIYSRLRSLLTKRQVWWFALHFEHPNCLMRGDRVLAWTLLRASLTPVLKTSSPKSLNVCFLFVWWNTLRYSPQEKYLDGDFFPVGVSYIFWCAPRLQKILYACHQATMS